MVPAEAIERAVTLLRAGGLVAYPTDTLYGLAVDPRSAEAVHRLFEVKGRHAGHAVPLIAADIAQAAEAARFDDRARRVAAAFWPGPLSIVLPAREAVRGELLGYCSLVSAHPGESRDPGFFVWFGNAPPFDKTPGSRRSPG